MTQRSEPDFYTNTPVSGPTLIPSMETVQMNGFVWSIDLGFMISSGYAHPEVLQDQLVRLRGDDEVVPWQPQNGVTQ